MCGCNTANRTGAPVQIRVSPGVAAWAVLTTGCSCFKDFTGVLTLLVLTCTELMETECGLKMVPVLDGILACEDHGNKVALFPSADLALWHTKRTNCVILTSFFRFVSLSFPPLFRAGIAGLKFSVPKDPDLSSLPVPQSPPAWFNLQSGLPPCPTPPIDASVQRKTYHQINVFWQHLEKWNGVMW